MARCFSLSVTICHVLTNLNVKTHYLGECYLVTAEGEKSATVCSLTVNHAVLTNSASVSGVSL